MKFNTWNFFFFTLIFLSLPFTFCSCNSKKQQSFSQKEKNGFLSIKINVVRVKIYINDVYSAFMDRTQKILHLKPGIYEIKFVKKGYIHVVKRIRILKDEQLPIEINLHKIAKKNILKKQKILQRRKKVVNSPSINSRRVITKNTFTEKKDLKKKIVLEKQIIKKQSKLKKHVVLKKKKVPKVYNATIVYIPPGTFKMGSPPTEPYRDSDEKLHNVALKIGFWMWESELTSKQFFSVMKYLPRRSSCKNFNRCPQALTWHEALMFCNFLSRKQGLKQCFDCFITASKKVTCKIKKEYLKEDTYKLCQGWRLPTEEEWEYAYRAGTTTPFYTGNCISTDQANYNGYPMIACEPGKYRKKVLPVKSLPPNPWGLFDMPGNLWEWTISVYNNYSIIIRGGSFVSEARHIRAAYRGAENSYRYFTRENHFHIGIALRPVRSVLK